MLSSDEDDEVMAGSEAAAANQNDVLAVMNASVGDSAMCMATSTAPEALPPLVEIFHDREHFETFHEDGKPRWRCHWCGEDFGGHNATKCLAHVCKVTGKGIKACTANIPKNHYKRYYDLYEKKMGAKGKKNGKYCVYIYSMYFKCYWILF